MNRMQPGSIGSASSEAYYRAFTAARG
jgi:hypothetical protein